MIWFIWGLVSLLIAARNKNLVGCGLRGTVICILAFCALFTLYGGWDQRYMGMVGGIMCSGFVVWIPVGIVAAVRRIWPTREEAK
jgi:hypothetical protein